MMNWLLAFTGMKPVLSKYKAFMLLPILLVGTCFFSLVLDSLYPPVVVSEYIYTAFLITACAVCAWLMILGVWISTKTYSFLITITVLVLYLLMMGCWLIFNP